MPEEPTPLSFPTAARLGRWFARNHDREDGAWFLIARKGTRPGVSYGEALTEALRWGWIDGKGRRRNERYFMLRFTPRRPHSVWSMANRRTVERLIAEGRMEPSGLARVEEAKANGKWRAAYSSRTVPPVKADVRKALAAAAMTADFRALSPSLRLQYLHWIEEAKRPATRARRIEKLASILRERPATPRPARAPGSAGIPRRGPSGSPKAPPARSSSSRRGRDPSSGQGPRAGGNSAP